MQKVVTVRASQKDLEQVTAKFISQGWRVVSVTKGSEWGRIGLSYKWTIILEIDDNKAKANINVNVNANRAVEDIKKESATKSYGKTALLCVGVVVVFFFLVAISMCAIS